MSRLRDRQRFSQFRNVGYPSCPSLARSLLWYVSRTVPRNRSQHAHVASGHCRVHIAFFGSLDDAWMFVQQSSIILRLPVGHSHTKGQICKSSSLQPFHVSIVQPFKRGLRELLPITKIGCRTSKRRPTLGSSSRFVETPACSRVEQAATCPKSPGQKTCATSDVSQLSRLGRSAVYKILKLSNPASAAAFLEARALRRSPAAAVAHDHIRSWCSATFPLIGLFTTASSRIALSARFLRSLLCGSIFLCGDCKTTLTSWSLPPLPDLDVLSDVHLNLKTSVPRGEWCVCT